MIGILSHLPFPEWMGTLNGISSRNLLLASPRGEAAGIDGTSEPASPADEGWRELESSKIPVEWYKTETNAIHPAAFIIQPVATPHQPRYAQQLFNYGMIAPGNHHFERFAALCNTPGGSQGVLTFSVYALLQSVCEPVPGQYRTGRVREPMYWYKPCALLSGGTAARADSIRPYWSISFKTSSL